MKLSYHWLRELVPGLELEPVALAELLTLHSFETVVAATHTIDPRVIVVRVLQIEPHPHADRLRLVTIDTSKDQLQVVCGATNFQTGDLVPYAPAGAKVLDEQGQLFELRAAKIRGVVSPGMLNSPRELGLGATHAGLLVLPSDTAIGTPLRDYVPDDAVLDAEVTPNRAHDCLCHLGVAREIAALLKLTVQEPATYTATLPVLPDWQLAISDSQIVQRYAGTYLDQVTIRPAPLWMQVRLLRLGLRPINNVVDMTNYVMLEQGNPGHAFDAAKLPGKTIGVRLAKPEEVIATLDGVTHELLPSQAVITSQDIPVAIAGVMGGQGAAVDEHTQTLWLEVAAFPPALIQQTARVLQLPTDSAQRFGKHLAPTLVATTHARALQLLQDLAGAHVVGGLEYYPQPFVPPTIAFDPSAVTKVAGIEYTPEQVRDVLTRLRCVVTENWHVTPPAERLDLTAAHELVEEVVRVQGLTRIAAQAPDTSTPQSLPTPVRWREALRDVLVQVGFTETYNYSFEPAAIAKVLGLGAQPHVQITNPVAPELQNLRVSLLPGLLTNIIKNKTEFRRQRLFEIGIVFSPGEGGRVPGVIETEHLTGVVVGEGDVKAYAQTVAETLSAMLGLGGLSLRSPAVGGTKGDGSYVQVEMLAPSVQKTLKLPQPVAYFSINVSEALSKATAEPAYEYRESGTSKYTPVSKYPPVFRDMAVRMPPEVTIDQVQACIQTSGQPLAVDVDLFDVYQSPDGSQRSVAFHIKYQADDRTLTDEEVSGVHQKITEQLSADFNVQVRS